LSVCLDVSRSVCVCVCSIVSESGASVYSASEQAHSELPLYDVSLRGAGLASHSVIHSHSLHSLTFTFTHSLTHSLTHLLTHSLTICLQGSHTSWNVMESLEI